MNVLLISAGGNDDRGDLKLAGCEAKVFSTHCSSRVFVIGLCSKEAERRKDIRDYWGVE